MSAGDGDRAAPGDREAERGRVGVTKGDEVPERDEGEPRADLSARSRVAGDPAKAESDPPSWEGRLSRAAALSTIQPVTVTARVPSTRPRADDGIPALTRPARVLATNFSGGTVWY